MHKLYFDEARKPVQTIQFDYGEIDSVEEGRPVNDNRDILRAALALLLSPAPALIAAARAAQVFMLLNPGTRPVDARRLFHGIRADDLRDARLELSSLLAGPDQGEEKAAADCAATASQKSTPRVEGGADAT